MLHSEPYNIECKLLHLIFYAHPRAFSVIQSVCTHTTTRALRAMPPPHKGPVGEEHSPAGRRNALHACVGAQDEEGPCMGKLIRLRGGARGMTLRDPTYGCGCEPEAV